VLLFVAQEGAGVFACSSLKQHASATTRKRGACKVLYLEEYMGSIAIFKTGQAPCSILYPNRNIYNAGKIEQ